LAFVFGPDWVAFGQQPVPALVAAAPVVERQLHAGQTFVGTVVPLRSARVGSPVDQRVAEFLVNEGDRVTRGQPMARLRTTTLEIDLAAARADLELRREELAELQNGSRPEEKEEARARVRSAGAQLKFAQARLQRTRQLAEHGSAASKHELDEATWLAEQAREMLAQAKAASALVEQGPRKERISQGRAKVQSQEELVRRMEDELDKHTIRAPFDGYVIAEHTQVGEWIAKGAVVAEIAQLDEVEVEVQVLEDYIQFVRVNDAARVEIGALPDRVFTGRVASIVAQANPRSRSFPVKVRLKNREDAGTVLLKAGMFARVMLPVGQRVTGLVVPKDAIVLGGSSPVVYVVERNAADARHGAVRSVPVELGVASGDQIHVKGALEAGQQVVVQGNERLRSGQEVTLAGP
jgi:RND family efflux transporter MFP subunit